MAKISWALGKTINLGDFESLRIDMSHEDDVQEGETPKEASDRIKALVDEEVGALVKQVEKKVKGRQNQGGY